MSNEAAARRLWNEMNRTGEIITGAWQCMPYDDLPPTVINALDRAVAAVLETPLPPKVTTEELIRVQIDQAKEAHEP